MLAELLSENAASRPREEAIVYREERISHADLLERTERLAGGLAERGIGPGDGVALVMGNDPSFVTGFYAVTALGGVVAPLNPSFKRDELEFAFRKCEVRAVLADERAAATCAGIAGDLEEPAEVITTGRTPAGAITLDELIEKGLRQELERRSPEEPFVYQFSSGSTGRPKRVARTHRQCRAEADSYPTMGMSAADRIFCAVPFFHTYGMGCCLFAAARTGATLVILEDPNPFMLKRERALEMLEREQVTWFPGVPFNYRLLADSAADADLSSLRMAFSAGTALPQATFEAFRQRFGIPVRQLYGCTEAGTLTANLDPDPVPTSESVGQPVGEVRVSILDDDRNPAPAGDVGEVAVSSPALTGGYSDMDELNRQVFRDGYFATGDLGRLDRDGRLYIAGRKKLLIEVGGYKVDPVEVQDVVGAHPAVAEAIVVGVSGRVDGEQVVKAAVVKSGELTERDLIRFCQERLANFKVPRVVEFREEIPKSPLGKVLRKYLV